MKNEQELHKKLTQVRVAAGQLRQLEAKIKNSILGTLIEQLQRSTPEILMANEQDLAALPSESSKAFRDRLTLTASRIEAMCTSLSKVMALPDPIGQCIESRRLENGLSLKRIRSPLGVILMIFESRPNVISEAFSLAFKAGNALILRGGKESIHTSKVLYSLIEKSLRENQQNAAVFWGITDSDRDLVQRLMQEHRYIDVLVPRGGESLIKYVSENSKIPVIKNDRGMCHTYVHEDADAEMAATIIENAKTQRPGVCNATETVLIHRNLAPTLLPLLYSRLKTHQVQWHTTTEVMEILGPREDLSLIDPTSFDTEYLDLHLNVKLVGSAKEAVQHVEQHGSRHSEAIVTSSEATARYFQQVTDAAVVYWNASTRFTDGYEFGLGGELGISTQKLHVRGPVGLNELTSVRWIVDGTGQVRR